MTIRRSSVEPRASSHTLSDARADDLEVVEEIAAPQVQSRKYSLLLLGVSVVWGTLMNQFGEGRIYWIMGPYAAAVTAVLLTLRSDALLQRLRPTLKNVAVGVAVGVAMTLATYPAFALAQQLFPQLAGHVSALYRQSHNESLAAALIWVVVILTAEELLWRGAWVEALMPRYGRLGAGALSVVIYALTQLCSGSFIVCLLALVCGAVWTAQRLYTGSVLAPLISHLIWTPTVILLVPVTW